MLVGGSKVGADSLHPITSGVVVGGCTTVSVTSATTPCSPAGFSYWVSSVDTWVPNEAPSLTATQMANNYASFDPGPLHPCQTGTTPAPPAASAFDSTLSGAAVEPDTSGSVSAGSAFELTPNFSYSCLSQNGASVGRLTWDNTAKVLTINGSIFFDSNLTISQSATYTGTAVIEAAGNININGNGTKICAVYSSQSNNCDWTNWQGTTSNRSMLTLVSLTTASPSMSFTNNAQSFQGSLWTQPTGSVNFVKNGINIEGPISVGTFDASFNNASFQPMPVITNMPVGAPFALQVPPSATSRSSSSTEPRVVARMFTVLTSGPVWRRRGFQVAPSSIAMVVLNVGLFAFAGSFPLARPPSRRLSECKRGGRQGHGGLSRSRTRRSI